MDRGYVDFERLFTLHRTGRFFVIHAKSTTKYRRRYSHPGGESGGVRCDRTIELWSSLEESALKITLCGVIERRRAWRRA